MNSRIFETSSRLKSRNSSHPPKFPLTFDTRRFAIIYICFCWTNQKYPVTPEETIDRQIKFLVYYLFPFSIIASSRLSRAVSATERLDNYCSWLLRINLNVHRERRIVSWTSSAFEMRRSTARMGTFWGCSLVFASIRDALPDCEAFQTRNRLKETFVGSIECIIKLVTQKEREWERGKGVGGKSTL